MSRREKKPRRFLFEHKVIGFAIAMALPGFVVSCTLIWLLPLSKFARLVAVSAELLICWVVAASLLSHVARPLQTLGNVIRALRDGDYAVRTTLAASNDALGELAFEVNALADLLAGQSTCAIEANALLKRVVEEVDLPIFAFDPTSRLRLVNSAGEKLLRNSSTEVMGKTSSELGLETCLSCESESLIELPCAADVRWLVRHSSFRQQGIPHTLLVLSDVSRALREEERRAWQRLIRVLGHELNNSLAPIKSIAGSLNARLPESGIGTERRQDFERGLSIIESRAASLNRFLQGYRQLAQMPPPVLQTCSVSELAKRVSVFETRVPIKVVAGPEVKLVADVDQLEQMLINLLRNAAEAVLQLPDGKSHSRATDGLQGEPNIVLSWTANGNHVAVMIEDHGPGLMNPSNVFVPFYTTKPSGSGIGLVLSRQIAEAHGGSLELSNSLGHRGCIVRITLPLKTTH